MLEQLETQFYTEAIKKFQSADFTSAGFKDPTVVTDLLTTIAGDEATHTQVLEVSECAQASSSHPVNCIRFQTALTALGATPISTCQFNFDSVLTDVKTTINVARGVENLGVSAYLGATLLIDDPSLLVDAASILTVESRHQTIHNVLAGGSAIATTFDVALSPREVLAVASSFISGCDLGIAGTVA